MCDRMEFIAANPGQNYSDTGYVLGVLVCAAPPKLKWDFDLVRSAVGINFPKKISSSFGSAFTGEGPWVPSNFGGFAETRTLTRSCKPV